MGSLLPAYVLVLLVLSLLQISGSTASISVRLVNGTSTEGRVEVRSSTSSTWGTVCDDDWGTAEATVVCNQLGFTGTLAVPIAEAYYGPGNGPTYVHVDSTGCSGSESNLGQCGLMPWGENDCEHNEDAGVMCLSVNPNAGTSVRIAYGLIASEGLVQVQYQGVWGTVCSEKWDDDDAGVVCRQLGYPGGRSMHDLHYGGGPIWMDNVNCHGNEMDLVDCPFGGWSEHNCDRRMGAGVFCEDTNRINYDVRLVGGNSSNEGRVEVQYNGVWGTVCDHYWSMNDANVVCRMLGYNGEGAIYYDDAYFGEGSGDIFVDNLKCDGTETNLGHCVHITAGLVNCDHGNDVGVCCPLDVTTTDVTTTATSPTLPVPNRNETEGPPGLHVYVCYPNGTIEVNNPNPSLYTDVMAVQSEGVSSATKCTVSASGSTVRLTGCSLDFEITVYFSDRVSGDDDVFVGQTDLSFIIQCNDILDSGIDLTVSNLLGATLQMTTQDAVTPAFTISSALRSGSQTGTEVFSATVGDELWWTIDIPSDYNGMPSCTAYSGSSNSGTPSQALVNDGCKSSDLVGDDFDNVDSGAVPLVKRLWTTLYVFRFYNSEDIYLECSVKLCPSSSSSCDLNCGGRKRSIEESIESDEMTVQAGRVLHILSHSGLSAAPAIRGCLTPIVVVTVLWVTLMAYLTASD